jgi:hypothetical protein
MAGRVEPGAGSLSIRLTAVHAVAYCGVMGAMIGGSLLLNPRMWLCDAPPAVREAAGPLDERTKRQRLAFGLPFILAVLSLPLYSNLQQRKRNGGRLSPPAAFLNSFSIFAAGNLFDLFVIDLWLVKRPPRAVLLPEVEVALKQHNTYGYHARAALRGLVYQVFLSALYALLTRREA